MKCLMRRGELGEAIDMLQLFKYVMCRWQLTMLRCTTLWVNFFFLNILNPFFACWQLVSIVNVRHIGVHIFLDNYSFITLCIIVLHFF